MCSLGKLDEKKSYQNFKGLKFWTKWLQRLKKNYTNFLVVCIHEIQIPSSKHMSYMYEIIMQKNMFGYP